SPGSLSTAQSSHPIPMSPFPPLKSAPQQYFRRKLRRMLQFKKAESPPARATDKKRSAPPPFRKTLRCRRALWALRTSSWRQPLLQLIEGITSRPCDDRKSVV